MSGIIAMPTDIQWPTFLEEVCTEYIEGRIDLQALEAEVERLLLNGTADEPSMSLLDE